MKDVNGSDAAFIALELLKLSDNKSVENYLDIMSKLHGFENICAVKQVFEENDRLRKAQLENAVARMYNFTEEELITLIDYIDSQKNISMESYVADEIINELKKHMKK